jgi:hypothetical protein
MSLLFTSNHAAIGIGSAPYPPFALGAIWFVGVSSYLLLVGIYSSALTVAKDTEIRQTIQRSVKKQLSLLHSIGRSEMEYQIKKNVLNITRRASAEIEPEFQASLEDNDIKKYIDKVIKEVKKERPDI